MLRCTLGADDKLRSLRSSVSPLLVRCAFDQSFNTLRYVIVVDHSLAMRCTPYATTVPSYTKSAPYAIARLLRELGYMDFGRHAIP